MKANSKSILLFWLLAPKINIFVFLLIKLGRIEIDQVQKDERKSKPQIRKQPNSQIVALGCSVYNRRVASDS